MKGFTTSVTDVLEQLDVLELLGFDNKTGTFVQDADSTAHAISETLEDITIAQVRLHATGWFLRQPTLTNYLTYVNAVPWVAEDKKQMLADFKRFLMARGACVAEPASSEIGSAAASE